MNLTYNYTTLNRNMNGPGTHIHTSTKGGFAHITINKCSHFDNEFQHVANDAEIVEFRIQVGPANLGIVRTMSANEDHLTIWNLPISEGDEIWIASSVINRYCVFGHTSKSSKY